MEQKKNKIFFYIGVLVIGIIIGGLLVNLFGEDDDKEIIRDCEIIQGVENYSCRLFVEGDNQYSFFGSLQSGCDLLKRSCVNALNYYGANCEWNEELAECVCNAGV